MVPSLADLAVDGHWLCATRTHRTSRCWPYARAVNGRFCPSFSTRPAAVRRSRS